jgi:hypothetical protein
MTLPAQAPGGAEDEAVQQLITRMRRGVEAVSGGRYPFVSPRTRRGLAKT